MFREIPLWKRYLPNLISLARGALGAFSVGILYAHGHILLTLLVFGLWVYTDKLDGQLARRWRVTSTLGKFLDPLADKLFIIPLLVFFVKVPTILVTQLVLLCMVEVALLATGVGAFFLLRAGKLRGFKGANPWGKRKFFCEACFVGLLVLNNKGLLSFFSEITRTETLMALFWVPIALAFASLFTYLMTMELK